MTEERKPSTDEPQRAPLDRREFLAGAGAAAFSFSIMKPELVRGSQANSKIALGMIGCGGRGTWIADLFRQHGGYEIVAAMDYFPDRVNPFGEKFSVPPERRYSGLRGYQRMLQGKLDAVAIESPPYFHPEQAAAAVDAGVHVYLAKPVAVDVPGCRSIEESSSKASAKNRCFMVDFQTRTDPFYQEAIRRVRRDRPDPVRRSRLLGGVAVHAPSGAVAGQPLGPGAPLARLGRGPGALRRYYYRAKYSLYRCCCMDNGRLPAACLGHGRAEVPHGR